MMKMKLSEKYDAICEEYKDKFIKKQGFSPDNCYWIADEIGGVLSCNEEYYFNIDEIRYDIDNRVKKGTILQAQDDFIDARYKDDTTPHINYKNYVKGLRYEQFK